MSALQPKPPAGGAADGLRSMEDVPLDAMDAKEFQRRVEELASRSTQQPPSGAEDDTGLSALQEVRCCSRDEPPLSRSHIRNGTSSRRPLQPADAVGGMPAAGTWHYWM